MKLPKSLFTWLRYLLLALQIQAILGPHGGTLLGSETPFFIPIPGLEGLADSPILLPLGWLAITGTMLLALGIKPRFTQPLAALSTILFQLATFNGRQAFTFLPPILLLGLSVRDRDDRPTAPILFLASIYLTASLQKLTHWNSMQEWLPKLLIPRLSAELRDLLGPEMIELIVRGMSYVVVPVEFAMGSLLLFERTRKFGFLLAVVFHTSLALAESGRDSLIWVSFLMLTAHAIIACDLARLEFSDFKTHRRFRQLLIATLILGGATAVFTSITDDFSELRRLLKTVAMLGPIILVAAFAYFVRGPVSQADVFAKSTWTSWPLRAFAVFIVVWSLGANLTGRRTEHLGWSMFSGASWNESQPVQTFSLAKDECASRYVSGRSPNVRYVIWFNYHPDHVVVKSRFENGLEKFKRFVKEKCPESRASETQLDLSRSS